MTIESAIKNTSPLTLSTRTVINMMYTARQIEESAALVFKTHGLTPQQYNVLRILRGQKGNPANLSTVQDRMIDKSSNTTRLIDKLIQKELVKRQICKKNRRKIEVFITSNGLELLKNLDPIIEKTNNHIMEKLSNDEKEKLNTLLDKLRD
ncbi:MAG: MarR family transcriptional regulator [Flavobacteriaceae bacterium]|nr:MarR family transcriptional regulator [Flavobacteriaceae bacterium]